MNQPLNAERHGENPAQNWQLDRIVKELRVVRGQWRARHGRQREIGGRELPSREALRNIVSALCGVLFPMRLGPAELREECEDFYVGHTLDASLNALLAQARLELVYTARQKNLASNDADTRAQFIVQEFAATLPGLRGRLDNDVIAAFEGDPAAHGVDEVLLCYPGVLAVIYYRIAHALHNAGLPLIARIIAEIAHSETGIDIHSGAQIGGGFFIDHGTGVVIGETSVIGNNVRIYQGVTLGAKRFPVSEGGVLLKGLPRHPVVEDNVVIYAGATILGRITIGCGSIIGGNVWLTHSVPPGSHVTQADTQRDSDATIHTAA